MVNYYEELNLNREDSIEEINRALNQLESTWRRREITNPEKATRILAQIIDAREQFSSESAKASYDYSIDNMAPQTSQVSDKLSDYYNQALSFYQTKQYDLAKESIDRAISMSEGLSDSDASILFLNASQIYFANDLFDMAIKHINTAITYNSNDATLYYSKGMFYVKWVGSIASRNVERISQGLETVEVDKGLFEKGSKCFESAMNLAHETGDTVLEGNAAGYMAFCLFRCEKPNYAKVKEVAERAVSLGDETGEGKSALYQVNNKEKELEEKAKIDSIRQMMLNESIPSSNIYYLDYYAEFYNFRSIKEEGEVIGTSFLETIIRTMRSFGVRFEDRVVGGIFGDFQRAGDYSKYKYKGFIVFYLPETGGGGMCPVFSDDDRRILVYLTADNRLVVDFRKNKILPYNTNNELALRIMEGAISDGYVSEKSLIVSQEKLEHDLCESDTNALNEEIKPQVQIISDKYKLLRNQLVQEKTKMLEEAIRNRELVISVQEEIQSLNNELKSLGFFDLKNKSALKSEIQNRQRYLSNIPTEESVESLYNTKWTELDERESSEVNNLKYSLKNKYPHAVI